MEIRTMKLQQRNGKCNATVLWNGKSQLMVYMDKDYVHKIDIHWLQLGKTSLRFHSIKERCLFKTLQQGDWIP